ncbi:cysteine-rich receptor-like protein kinase 25 [Quercus suber]|uniref:Cysteine-rich receptor-like protein kinase 25 n=1 Tax=Quercus suber TaxID=58331 RepID=A0AAW0LQD1_QUESU
MNDLASQLSNVRAGAKKFGTKEATFTALQTLYTLAQCTPDITGVFKIAINTLPGCCGGKQMGSVLFLSCIVKYAVSPFYKRANTLAPTPPQEQVPGSTISPKGNFFIFIFIVISFKFGLSSF